MSEKGTIYGRPVKAVFVGTKQGQAIEYAPMVRCSECKHENKCNKHISTWEIGDDMEHYWADRPVEFCGYGERKE